MHPETYLDLHRQHALDLEREASAHRITRRDADVPPPTARAGRAQAWGAVVGVARRLSAGHRQSNRGLASPACCAPA